MISSFPSPILSVAADVVKDLEGEDALCSLWTLFTKCKESLKDGRRLENISWRLWYREMASAQCSPSSSPGSLSPPFSEKRSPSPITPVSEDGLVAQQAQLPHRSLTPSKEISTAYSWHAENSANTVITAGRRLSTASAPMERQKSHSSVGVGKMILDILPCKVSVNSEKAARSSTVPHIAQPRPVVATLPTVQLPATPPQPQGPSFPRVVVVNPTPHPTPPATPSVSHPLTVTAQTSTHLLPPPPARSFVAATISAAPAGNTKPPLARKAASPPHQVRRQPAGCSTLTSKPSTPMHDAIQTDVTKPKKYNDDTLKASDRRFFLQDAGSPDIDSPERPESTVSDALSPTQEHAHGEDPEGCEPEPSPSSGTSSHIKSDLTSHAGITAGGAAKRPRVQGRKAKERHMPVRPALQRLHSHGLRQTLQKKAAAAADTKKTTFNIGSVSSNGSRSGKSVKEEKKEEKRDKEKEVESSKARPSSLSANAKQAATQAKTSVPPANIQAAPVANGTGPSQQRRGIMISTSSEYETTDTDDDSEWASEDSSEDKTKERRAKAAEEARLREAAEEAQRQRDMFAKVPKRSYSNLNRTRSGLLSQLLNPDPKIFPPNHPYRTSHSTQDMTQFGRQGPAPALQMRKSTAAVPLAAQITTFASVAPVVAPIAPESGRQQQNGYRPKGRPQEQEMEDSDSEEENPDDTIQVSRSLAQQKLAALADPNRRRHSDRGLLTQQQQQMQQGAVRPLPSVSTAPIPLNHPYNLPAPAPPMTPRTTRRQMLQTELSESLRRNLLWERQVSRINMTGRRPGVLGAGLRPLTAMNGEGSAAVQQQQPGQGQQPQAQQQLLQQNSDETEERRRRAIARNRSWADEYHYSGW